MNLKISIVCCFVVFLYSKQMTAQNTLPYDTSYTFQHYELKQAMYKCLPNRNKEIVFVGNSIIERGPWNELFKNKKIINRGIGGDISFGVSNRLNTIVDSNPKMVFIMIGINDIGRSIPTDTIAKKICEIVLVIKEKSPKTKVFLHSVLPINEKIIWYDYMKSKSDFIVQLNNKLEVIARDENVGYVNLYTHFADSNGQLKPELTCDGLHLSAAGYLLWKEIFDDEKIKF
ncbi:GDSL family lipase [Marinilabiliaceae bacterium JC017]|nr:GDSL family lipase [Marinilabiliaceae bacterium JC017]